MEYVVGIVLIILAVLVLPIVGGILGIRGYFLIKGIRQELSRLYGRVRGIEEQVQRLERSPGWMVPAGKAEGAAPKPAEAARPAPLEVMPAAAPERPAAPEAPPGAERLAGPPTPPRAPQPPKGWAMEPAGGQSWAQFEKSLGTRWVAYAGVTALFFATAFFVKYAFDSGWIGPTARVVIGIVFGLVLLVAGDVCIRRKMAPLGQTLIGGGLAILYLSFFAAYKWYALMTQPAGFGAMILVTAAGMTLAVLHNAPAVSVLAVLGGFLTPVLLSTGEDARDALFTYVLLLDLGVMGVATFRKWRALELLAFAGTCILYSGWHDEFYQKEMLTPAMLWLGAFYAVFLVLPFLHHLRMKGPARLEAFLLALVNAAYALTYSYGMLYAEHKELLGFLAVAASAAYLVMGVVLRKRTPSDEVGLLGLIALAVTFLTLAVPLELGLNGILLAWAIEGPVLLYLGYEFRYTPVRFGALVILVLAFMRLFSANWPHHNLAFILFWNVKFGAAVCVPLAAAAFALVHQRRKPDATVWDSGFKIAAAVAGLFAAIMLVDFELRAFLEFRADEAWASREYLPGCASVLVWTLGAAAFLAGTVRKCRTFVIAGLAPLAVTLWCFLNLYGSRMTQTYGVFVNLRFAASLVAVCMVFTYAWVVRRTADSVWGGKRIFATVLYSVAAVALLVLASIEPYTYALWRIGNHEKARWVAQMALSIVWSVYAAAALALGFWKRIRGLRFAALALFGLTAIKVVTVDMANLRQIYRIISFFGLGILLIGASYLYHRVEKKIAGFFGEKR